MKRSPRAGEHHAKRWPMPRNATTGVIGRVVVTLDRDCSQTGEIGCIVTTWGNERSDIADIPIESIADFVQKFRKRCTG